MVTITDGKNVLVVSKGAFKNVYRCNGYKEVCVEDINVGAAIISGDTVAINPFAELEAKPISQWNKTEVKEYADANGIDLSGTKNVNEGKERIKAFMETR